MDREIRLTLQDSFVGQILDVLRQEQEAWSYTRCYLLGGVLDVDRLIKEDSTPEGARKMVDYYQEIIDAIEGQRR